MGDKIAIPVWRHESRMLFGKQGMTAPPTTISFTPWLHEDFRLVVSCSDSFNTQTWTYLYSSQDMALCTLIAFFNLAISRQPAAQYYNAQIFLSFQSKRKLLIACTKIESNSRQSQRQEASADVITQQFIMFCASRVFSYQAGPFRQPDDCWDGRRLGWDTGKSATYPDPHFKWHVPYWRRCLQNPQGPREPCSAHPTPRDGIKWDHFRKR